MLIKKYRCNKVIVYIKKSVKAGLEECVYLFASSLLKINLED